MSEQTSTQLNELFMALSKAQGEMESCGLESDNPFFKSKYAKLPAIIKASRPALIKHGLCVTQDISSNEKGQIVVRTILAHSSGQFIPSEISYTPAKTDIQSLGSVITYLRRYSYAAVVGVIITDDEDDDGNEASGTGKIITDVQAKRLMQLMNGDAGLSSRICKHLQINSLNYIPADRYNEVCAWVEKQKNQEVE